MNKPNIQNIDNIKACTSAEYIRRIDKALNFIDNHLDQVIRLDDIARASHFSPFHFHRIFHALVGETVNAYVSRKRIEKSAMRLLYQPALNVTQVAEAGDYSSSANFSRAFKNHYGVSPSEFRRARVQYLNDNGFSKIGNYNSKSGKAVILPQKYSPLVTHSALINSDNKEKTLKIIVEDMAEKHIAYLTSDKGYQLDSVFATWERIIDWADNKGVDSSLSSRFAICHDDPVITPEDKCRYDASIVVNADVEVDAPYTRSIIPAGKYAIAYFKDDADKISGFISAMCSQWFPDSGFEPDNHPPIFNYLNDSRVDDFVEMNVYIKVKSLELE